MKQAFSDQLSMWRTANGVATMKEVLHDNTSIVKENGKTLKVVRPHAHIKTGDSKVLGLYVHFKLSLIKITGKMRVAVDNDDLMEFELLKEDINKISTKFFNAIRSATGYENVMGINHEDALEVLEDGSKLLKIYLYPMQANGKAFDFKVVPFTSESGEQANFPCLIIPVEEKKVYNKRKKRGKKK